MEISRIQLKNIDGYIAIHKNDTSGDIFIERFNERNKIRNIINNYEYISSNGNCEVKKLTIPVALSILEKIKNGVDYSSSFIFSDVNPEETYSFEKSEMEHKYTSTGIKFWRHTQQLLDYKNNSPNTIISTHISPEGACNLKCPYCSVTYRNTHSRIKIDVIKDYVVKLKSRGLKAVIITGGGEPTLYKDFNELVQWIKKDQGLSVSLITNGTNSLKVNPETWKCFSWVRVSINMFENWENKINLPVEFLDTNCVVGASVVLSAEHQLVEEQCRDRLSFLRKVSGVANKINAKYIRVLPNCLLNQNNLVLVHRNIDVLLKSLNDGRFFHQHKLHGAPKCNTCHQAYFRPYLSEEPFYKNNKPGAVYPCDSLVLNNSNQRFLEKYQICAAEDILEFIDKKIKMNFNPMKDCSGCVFTSNVNMLDDWVIDGINKFSEYNIPLEHEEFV